VQVEFLEQTPFLEHAFGQVAWIMMGRRRRRRWRSIDEGGIEMDVKKKGSSKSTNHTKK